MTLAASPHSSSLTSRVARLAWPILVGQLAVVANGVIDTAMTARYSATDLAVLGLGASIYISVFVGLSGVLQALSPTIAQLFGAKKIESKNPRGDPWSRMADGVPLDLPRATPAAAAVTGASAGEQQMMCVFVAVFLVAFVFWW